MSLRLSTIIVFSLPKFRFFTTLSLSHSYIDYLFKFYNVIYTNAHSRYKHPSSTTTKFSTILIVLHIFQSSYSFHYFEKTSITFVRTFKVKATIGRRLRWTKCTIKNVFFFFFWYTCIFWRDFVVFLSKIFNDIDFYYY